MRGPTAQLAEFVVALRFEDLPTHVVERASAAVLDLLGCALAGVPGEAAAACRVTLGQFCSASSTASVWGTPERLAAPFAAMANAVASRQLILDDIHRGAKLHPGSIIIPTAFAVAEERESRGVAVNGKRIVEALAVGYEVAVRVSIAAGPAEQRFRGWHPTGTCGPIGAAAAAARLLQLDPRQTLSALGLGGNQAAGLSLHHTDGSQVGAFNSGHAAAGGILAAYLAQSGFQGPEAVLESEDSGLCRALTGTCDTRKLTDGLGRRLALSETGIKMYACCRSAHSPVHGVIALRREYGFLPAQVQRVVVYTNRVTQLQCGRIRSPQNPVQAKVSMAYCVAVGICDLAASPEQFLPDRLNRPDVRALAQKVDTVVDPAYDSAYPQNWPCRVEIELVGGRRLSRLVAHPPGDPEDPITWPVLAQKVNVLIGERLPPDRLDRLIARVAELPELPSVALISECLVGE